VHRAMVPAPEAAEEPAATPSRWRQAFEGILKQILRDYEGQDPKAREGMNSGMRRLFEKPYEVELGALFSCRSKQKTPTLLSTEDAQRVVFFPRLSDMQVYVDAFALDTPDATARREKLMKLKLLSVFYTLHRHDGALVDRFMHCGGLQSLVELLTDDNPVVQSEAVELLMEFLSPQMMLPAAASARQAHLQHQVWRSLVSREFWQNFAKIIGDPAERFPKSHENCVRILAGAVGWLRPEAGAIPEAVAAPDVSEAAEALKAYLESGVGIRPDIRGCTEDLLQELLDVPKIREDPLRGEELVEAREDLFDEEAVERENAAHAWQALRRLGGEAFGAGLLWPAEAAYRLALEEGASVVPHREASIISSNRALVLLKAGHPAEAADAAAEALRRDPRNAKAAYRRALGLLEQLPAAGAALTEPLAVAAAAAAAKRRGRRGRCATGTQGCQGSGTCDEVQEALGGTHCGGGRCSGGRGGRPRCSSSGEREASAECCRGARHAR